MVNKEHICYLSSPPKIPEEENEKMVFYTKKLLKKKPIDFSCIKVFERLDYHNLSDAASKCFDNIASFMGFDFQSSCSVVCCKMAMPHNDPSFEGDAFVSLVLHTGKSPYCFSMHSQNQQFKKRRKGINPFWEESRRFLTPGDVLVMNPVGLHSALPVKGSTDSMLILFQGIFPFGSDSEKEKILYKFKRSIFDREEFDEKDLDNHNTLIW